MKVCTTCKFKKELTEFNKANASRYKDGLQPQCRACSKRHYQLNKAKYKERIHARNNRVISENQLMIFHYLRDHPCVDCGETDIVVLTFDHVRGTKHKAISEMVRSAYSWTAIKDEISKCEVRCANDHTRRTAAQFGWSKLEFLRT